MPSLVLLFLRKQERPRAPEAHAAEVSDDEVIEDGDTQEVSSVDELFCQIEGIDAVPLEWDNPTMIVTLDSKRRLTVPAALAPATPGEYFDARFDAEEDAIVFRRLAGKEDWLAVLKECPVSMDDVPPRRREVARRRRL
jgi:hypothetical protein